MMVRAAHSFSLTAEPTGRWWDWAKRPELRCYRRPFGHHIPRITMTEAGFCACAKLVPDIGEDLLRLWTLKEKRLFDDADRWAIALRSRGVEPPSDRQLAEMARTSQKRPCDRNVFICAIRGGGIIIAEVSPNERLEMEHLSTPTEMLDYLGVLNTNRDG